METGRISEGAGGSPGLLSSGSDKGESGQFSTENHIAHRGSDHHPKAVWPRCFSLRFFMDLPGSATGRAERSRRANLRAGNTASEGAFPPPFSLADNHRMHDASRQQGEQPGDHQAAAEDADHDSAVAAHMVAVGAHDGAPAP